MKMDCYKTVFLIGAILIFLTFTLSFYDLSNFSFDLSPIKHSFRDIYSILKRKEVTSNNTRNVSVQSTKGVRVMNSKNEYKIFESKQLDIFDYFPKLGKPYVLSTSTHITYRYRKVLEFMGYEPAVDHNFSSPFITTPVLYPDLLKQIIREKRIKNRTTIGFTSLSYFSDPFVKELLRVLERTNVSKPGKRKKKIVSVYKSQSWITTRTLSGKNAFDHCPYSECELDLKSARIDEADVVMALIPEQNLANRMQLMEKLKPHQTWISISRESPVNYDFPGGAENWRGVFNYIMTMQLDADIWTPVFRFVWRKKSLLYSDEHYYNLWKNKTKDVAWLVSNCKTQSEREIFVKELQKYIQVDIYGACGNNSIPKKVANESAPEVMLTKDYKFYLSFENSLCKDYVTEKFGRSFEYRSHYVSIVRSAFNYKKYIPPNTFIDASDFESPKHLADYLKDLGRNGKKYAAMLKERDKLDFWPYTFDWCDICEIAHRKNTLKIQDVHARTHQKHFCHQATDL